MAPAVSMADANDAVGGVDARWLAGDYEAEYRSIKVKISRNPRNAPRYRLTSTAIHRAPMATLAMTSMNRRTLLSASSTLSTLDEGLGHTQLICRLRNVPLHFVVPVS